MHLLRIFGLKLLQIVPVLLLVTLATTLLLNLTPGDPARLVVGEAATPQQLAIAHHQLGLDKSVVERYTDWLGKAVTGDFGRSYRTQEPVITTIGQRFPVTLELMVLAMVMALALAVPSGIYAAYRRDRIYDKGANLGSTVLIAAPPFITGVLLLYVFGIRLEIFPVTGWVPLTENVGDNLWHAFLPSVTLALGLMAVFHRLMRSDMQSVLQEEYVAAASARGLSARYVLFRHALKPASLSLLTVAGLSIAALAGGTVITEQLFGLPGVGTYLLNGILTKDYIVVQGVVLLIAFLYVLVNAVVDVLYVVLDPRVEART